MSDNNGLFKTAFLVSVGLCVGKYVGEAITELCEMACESMIKHIAENGDQQFQEVCKKRDIHYETSKDDNTKMRIGFHV